MSSTSSARRTTFREGKYYRKSDGQWIHRFCCSICKKSYSSGTSLDTYRQKKRHKNQIVKRLLAGGVSQRECARILNINRKTVVRKLLFWARRAEAVLESTSNSHSLCVETEFDDLETFEHTKCKPLSVTLMVEAKTRRVLDVEVARMPAKGKLAVISRKKYGYRKDERPRARALLFARLQKHVHPRALIRSDSNPHYVPDVKKFFPYARQVTIKGARGSSTGGGELKKINFDPIFSLNHTCAMFRAHLSRLIRKTWCTTQTAGSSEGPSSALHHGSQRTTFVEFRFISSCLFALSN